MITDPVTKFKFHNYSVPVPSMDAIKEGYVYSGMNERGSVLSSPSSFTMDSITNFSRNLFNPDAIFGAEKFHYLNDEYYSTMNAMGITSDPSKGDNFRPIGTDDSGQMLYSTQQMITSADNQLGAKSINNTVGVIDGFSRSLNKPIFEDGEKQKLDTVASNSQDLTVQSELTMLKRKGDSEGFIEKIFDYFTDGKGSVTTKGTKEGKTKEGTSLGDLLEGAGTAYQAYAMYQMWDYLSPAQKGIGLASIGIKAYDIANGGKLAEKVLVDATVDSNGKEIVPALKVGDALDLFSAGYNAYSLAKNWDQLSDINKLVGGAGTVLDIAKSAKSLGLIGEGLESAAVATSAKELTAAGFSSVPHLGIGALVGPSDAVVPKGYTVTTYANAENGGKLKVIVPKANAQSAEGITTSSGSLLNSAIGYGSMALAGYGAVQNLQQGNYLGAAVQGMHAYQAYQELASTGAQAASAGAEVAAGGTAAAGGGAAMSGMAGAGLDIAASIPGTAGAEVASTNAAIAAGRQGATAGLSGAQIAGGVAGIAAGAYMIYQGWGQGGTEGAVNGALGGASMAAGLYVLGATNPFLLAGVVAVAALSGLIKTGKHEDQVARDQVRARFKKMGLVDDNWNITLADGTLADIGMDGDTGAYMPTDPEKLQKYAPGGRSDGKLAAYDVDFTNDVAYMASLGGTTLSRIISGGAAKNVDQLGGQLGNAFLANVDWQDGQLTEEKWRKIAANQRAVFARAGIKSKSDGLALVNQLYAEGRINEFEHTQMQQALAMMYNEKNGWWLVQKLNSGRWNGVSVAADKKDVEDPRKVGSDESEKEAA
jgi:hypothetical protein